MFSLKRLGFTMIELLIVIAVLGILAVAVLSAINPIEQINRGRDTGSRSDAEQLVSAIDRYYASKGYYPWSVSADSLNKSTFGGGNGAVVMSKLISPTQTLGADAQAPLANLSTGGASELKDSFISRITTTGYNNLYLYNDGDVTSSTYACFVPKSAAFREEAWKRCAITTDSGVTYNTNTAGLPKDMPVDACPNTDCGSATTPEDAKACYICLP